MPAQSVFDSTRVLFPAELYFAFGKYQLDTAAQRALDQFAQAWNQAQNADKARITAHTDSVGGLENNVALSERRAQAVKTALVQRGIPEARIELSCFGERRPVATNSTDEGRQRNRRATLEILRMVPMTPYSGQVKDRTTGEGIASTVHFSTKTLRDSVQTDSSGKFSVQLPKDSVVKVEAYAEGYFFSSFMERIFGTREMVQRMHNRPPVLSLAPARAGEKAILNNLFFVGNEAILLKNSEPELPKVLKFMQINPNLIVEIAGHINHPGVAPEELEKWEWQLSVNRAKLVYEYLLRNGIPKSRMSFKGYGNTEMLFPQGGTAEQQEQNRRVEIRVLNTQMGKDE